MGRHWQAGRGFCASVNMDKYEDLYFFADCFPIEVWIGLILINEYKVFYIEVWIGFCTSRRIFWQTWRSDRRFDAFGTKFFHSDELRIGATQKYLGMGYGARGDFFETVAPKTWGKSCSTEQQRRNESIQNKNKPIRESWLFKRKFDVNQKINQLLTNSTHW